MSGRYLILSELAKGGGSIVYLARHQKLGEYRAVKCISKESDSTFKIREALLLNRLKHPQIPVLYDMEEDEKAYYIIEEYVEGESLEALMLQSSFITPDFIYHTIMEVSAILDYLHHFTPDPVIYQDLKPEHVIFSKNGIKLIDFGIASSLGEPGNKFQNYGTPEFCAPEKLKEAKISIQTDIYSLGKLLEQLIFAEGQNMSRSLMHVANKAMDCDLSVRYGTVESFQADLAEHMQSKQVSINQKHLLKKIVIAGSQPRIGTTHISISFTEYLNQKNISSIYQEKNSSNHFRMSVQKGSFYEKSGIYQRKNFIGMPAYGEGVCVEPVRTAVEILDYGTEIKEALLNEPDLFLLIIGSREWEIEYANLAYEQLQDVKGLIVISNYGSIKQAKEYAKRYARTVYCFPLDENPFYMTKEKERLFERLLEKEREKDNKHWDCRKHPGKWGNSLVCSIGKLCNKRIR